MNRKETMRSNAVNPGQIYFNDTEISQPAAPKKIKKKKVEGYHSLCSRMKSHHSGRPQQN